MWEILGGSRTGGVKELGGENQWRDRVWAVSGERGERKGETKTEERRDTEKQRGGKEKERGKGREGKRTEMGEKQEEEED